MDSRIRLSYHSQLFIMLLGFSWALVACFVLFQYHREKQYKADKLDAQLQLFNTHLLDALEADTAPAAATVGAQHLPVPGLRISVISRSGALLYDNSLDTLPGEKHLGRPEIRRALINGNGYTIRRHSSSTDNTYFYSATRGDSLVVRSAVPYSVPLADLLATDRTFLWFMLAATLAISAIGYFATRRIGRTITRLNRFAAKAEKGETSDDNGPFPHDELGSISGHIIRLYGRLRQTMEERDAEHRRAMHEQQEKTRIKKQLTNNINHELKTPVAAIMACLETLLAHPGIAAEKRTEFIERCYGEAQRLSNLLNDVADITRMDDGAQNIAKTTVDIGAIVADVAAGEEQRLRRAGITLRNGIPEGVRVNGNPAFISSIFRNLADNAIAYSGASELRITLDDATPAFYTFSVTDNGCGIPAEHLSRIFERFYRIDKGRSRRLGGTGLGLAIVRNAVQLHGGAIHASTPPGGGARFTFTLAAD